MMMVGASGVRWGIDIVGGVYGAGGMLPCCLWGHAILVRYIIEVLMFLAGAAGFHWYLVHTSS